MGRDILYRTKKKREMLTHVVMMHDYVHYVPTLGCGEDRSNRSLYAEINIKRKKFQPCRLKTCIKGPLVREKVQNKENKNEDFSLYLYLLCASCIVSFIS